MNKFFKNKTQIIDWLERNEIENYELLPDNEYGFVVNTNSGVDLNGRSLKFIPVKFNIAKWNFDCSNNQLTSLEFSPVKVERTFSCSNNLLSSLEGAPQECAYFYCYYNRLTSLKGAPKKVIGFSCGSNKLKSLEYCPEKIMFEFNFQLNLIETLDFLPQEVGGQLSVEENPIITQLNIPKEVTFQELKAYWDKYKLERQLNEKIVNHKKIKI